MGDWFLLVLAVAPMALACLGGWIAYSYPRLWFWLM